MFGITLPTWSDIVTGAAPWSSGLLAETWPVLWWVCGVAFAVGLLALIQRSVSWAIRRASHVNDKSYDMSQGWGDENYIKPGSVEDLSNQHYGYHGRQKETADRLKLHH